MENDTLNDFIHASAAQMFEDNPNKSYGFHEGMIRETVTFLGKNRSQDFIRLPGHWKITRKDLDVDGVIWKLDKQVLSYTDRDDETPNTLSHLN